MDTCVCTACAVSYPIWNFHGKKTEKHVLQSVSCTIRQGAIFALLGINGAGKTTLIQSILGLQPLSSGNITIFGQIPGTDDVLSCIGYAPDATSFYPHLTGEENVRLFSSIGNHSAVSSQTILARFQKLELTHGMHLYVSQYSAGMKKRLGLIMSLIHDPDFIIWDEPMSGLDPVGRSCVKNVMMQMHAAGKTILFSTHILPDVVDVATDVGLLHTGRIILEKPIKMIPNLEQTFVDLVQGCVIE